MYRRTLRCIYIYIYMYMKRCLYMWGHIGHICIQITMLLLMWSSPLKYFWFLQDWPKLESISNELDIAAMCSRRHKQSIVTSSSSVSMVQLFGFMSCNEWNKVYIIMMKSSNGNIFRVTGPLCGEFTGHREFRAQRPVTRSFDVFFDMRLNKRFSKGPFTLTRFMSKTVAQPGLTEPC